MDKHPAMRVVLYCNETMEPITVIHLQSWMTTKLVDGQPLHVPMVRPIKFNAGIGPIERIPKSYVTIWFEKFIRHGQPHWFAFTADGKDAVLLKAVFLPGQQREVQSIEQKAFMSGMLALFDR